MSSKSKNRSALGRFFIKIVPTVEGFSDEISKEIEKGYEDAKEPIKKKSEEIGEESGEPMGEKMGAKVAIGLMAALVAAKIGQKIGDAIAAGMEQQDINAKLAAKLALSPEQQAIVEESAKGLYVTGMGESYNDVANTMSAIVGTIKDASSLSQEELQKMGQDVMTLSDVWETDANQIAKTANIMIANGMAKNWDDAVYLITSGFQELGAYSDDWLDTLTEFSDDFVQFGFDGASSIKLIQAFLDAGIKDTDKIADSLNELGINARDVAKEKYFIDLGFDPGQVRKNLQAGGMAARTQYVEILNALKNTTSDSSIAISGELSNMLNHTLANWEKSGKEAVTSNKRYVNDLLKQIKTVEGRKALEVLNINVDEFEESIKSADASALKYLEKLDESLAAIGSNEYFTNTIGTISEDFAAAFGTVDLSGINDPLRDGVGNIDKIAESLNTASVSMEAFNRIIEQGFVEILTPALEVITPLLASFVGWLQENETAAKILAGIITGIMVIALLAMTYAMWGMASAAFAAAAGGTALSIGFAPFILIALAIIAVIALIVAAVIWAVDNWWWLGESLQAGLAAIGGAFIAVGKFIVNFFAAILNVIIAVVNGIIFALNMISFDVPDWVPGFGGSHFGFNIPMIPSIPLMMADGGTVPAKPGGTLAILGEAGKDEVVMDAGKWNTMLDNINNGGTGGTYVSNITINAADMDIDELSQKLEENQRTQALEWGLLPA